MRTRNQAKKRREEEREEGGDKPSVGDISEESSSKKLKWATPYRASRKERVKMSTSLVEAKKTNILSKESVQGVIVSDNNIDETRVEEQVAGTSIGCTILMTGKDTGEPDWEDGTISNPYHKDNLLDFCETHMNIEFDESPSLAQRRTIRRASSEDKILAELVHKVHLLCLLARGRFVDNACSDPLLQASLLSLLPSGLLEIGEVPNLTLNKLVPLINWFCTNFHVQSSSMKEGDFTSNLYIALETREGTAEEVAALSVALFRALNLSVRFVSILDVASLKPDIDAPDSNQNVPRFDTKISSSSSSKVMVSSAQASTFSLVHSSSRKSRCMEITPKSAQRDMKQTKPCDLACNNKKLSSSPDTTVVNNVNLDTSDDKSFDDNKDVPAVDHPRNAKRKGDVEFELQLEMALSATEAVLHGSNSSTELNDISGSLGPALLKKFRKIERRECGTSTLGSMGAVWSRKAGPPLYWAEVYCSGEALTGRWVHVDAANGIVDGEQQIESAFAACRRLLKYAVAFAGFGAKDVTRRYCMQWYKIASQRINSSWWDAVLAPLKQLESAATGGVVCSEVHQVAASTGKRKEAIGPSGPGYTFADESLQMHTEGPNLADAVTRESLEDMELETRALTEPLPTNQLAYRNHNMYTIERWLTKFQVLHPKGPVLGYCSGHPVYPRACVQMLQTKRKWLREGMQVKVDEVPAKVVKFSQKFGKRFTSEPSVVEEDDNEPMMELYGKWQVEPLCLPPAVDGIVPKNERGQVEVWSEKCLPPGTVHLRFPRLVPVAKRLEVDFAPAMVRFEFRNGHSCPIFEGIVVCTEFKDAILEAYAEEEARREAEEKRWSEAQALSRWYQLLCSIITRQRLKRMYEDVSYRPVKGLVSSSASAPNASHEVVTEPNIQQEVSLESSMQVSLLEEDHEHVFPIECQNFDEARSIRTKRCPCGFSIQMEEL